MQHLRVGFFTEVYRPVVNGVVASVDGLADGLRSRGHEVYCFAPKVPGYEEEDGPVFRMPSLPLPTRTPYRLTLPLVSRRNLVGVIKKLSIVHVHSPFITGWMGLRYARRYGIPLVYTYHTQLEEYAHYVPFEPHTTRLAASALTRGFADLTDAVVVPTSAMAARLREIGVGTRIEVVPSGIDLRHFGAGKRNANTRDRFGVPTGKRMLLLVSRLAKEKSVDILIEALALAPQDLHLVIAGDGPARESLQSLACERDVASQITFAGAIEREALPDMYASADAFVFPSTTETQGLVLAEALAAGAFVIAADVATNRDVLGRAGRLVPPTVAGFAKAITAVPHERDEAEGAHARAGAARFSVESQSERMLDLYLSLTKM